MTLDEAIEHAHAIAKECGKCADEHEQLAGWLEELKALKEKPDPLKKHDQLKELLYDLSRRIFEDDHEVKLVVDEYADRIRNLLGGDAE